MTNEIVGDTVLDRDAVRIGRFFSVNFQRTLRLPDDGRDYPLPPGLGRFPLRRVSDFAERVPREWSDDGGFLLPMHRHEAMWLSFSGPYWHPVGVRVDVGGVCALTGATRVSELSADPQNYMVVPEQPWLDGIKAGEGIIRQFVAAPLGTGVTIEGQVTGREEVGGLRITVVPPHAGRFPEEPPREVRFVREDDGICAAMVCEAVTPLGLGAGGRMVQKIYPDAYGLETWDESTATTATVHLLDANDWHSITGEEPPPSPISVDLYRAYGLPWFALMDHDKADLPVSPILAGIKPISFGP